MALGMKTGTDKSKGKPHYPLKLARKLVLAERVVLAKTLSLGDAGFTLAGVAELVLGLKKDEHLASSDGALALGEGQDVYARRLYEGMKVVVAFEICKQKLLVVTSCKGQ